MGESVLNNPSRGGWDSGFEVFIPDAGVEGGLNKFSYYPTVGASGFVDYAASPEADSSSSGMSSGSFFLPVASRSA